MMKSTLLICAALALLAIHGNVASAATQAGVSAAVRGDIDLAPVSGEAKHQAASGEDVFLGDAISSYDNAGMQLMLLDETVFTIGANTDLTVDEFVYDPATGVGEVVASVTKGVFRFVTGNIAQGDPEDMTINLPTGTIGIRGTIGAASMLGGVAMIVLLGPGPDNNADARQGHLEVSAQGVTVNLTRPRWGTIIEPGQPPSPPALFTDAQIAGILNALGSAPAVEEPTDVPAAGVATVLALQDIADAVGAVQEQEASEAPELVFDETLVAGTVNPFGSLTTFGQLDQLAQIPGSGTYGNFNDLIQFGDGDINDHHYHLLLEINFNNRTIGGVGANNRITFIDNGGVTGGIDAIFQLNAQNFDDALGANFDLAVFLFEQGGISCSGNCDAAAAIALNGADAGTAFHALAVSNGSTTSVGSGEATLN